MGRVSTVDLLPTEVRDQLIAWIEDPAINVTEAHERTKSLLGELGIEQEVSRSAVGRKAKSHKDEMKALGASMREAKANTEAFYKHFGEQQTDGGKFLAETLQAFIFKMNMALHSIEDVDTDDLFLYSKVIKNLTGSVSQLEDVLIKFAAREAEIRKQALAEAADAVETAVTASGMSAERVAQIKAEILGIG